MFSLHKILAAAVPVAMLVAPIAAHATTVSFDGGIPSGNDPVGGAYTIGDTGGGLVQFEEIAGGQPDPTQDVLFTGGNGLTQATSFTLTITGSSAQVLSLDAGFGNAFAAYLGGNTVPTYWNATENAAGTAITYTAASAADALKVGDRFGTYTTIAASDALPAGFAYTITWSDAPIATPEPAAWALMIFGFGAIGATMRRSGKVRLGFA